MQKVGIYHASSTNEGEIELTGIDNSVPTRNVKGIWYKRYISECPLCGRGDDERTRMPPPKPENPEDIYEYEQVYDWCEG